MHLTDKIQVFNEDCMAVMSRYPDKYFDLAVVDPPYGIGADLAQNNNRGKNGYKLYKESNWDLGRPQKRYFDELSRVSVNQIVFGGNYFVQFILPTMGWIVWDKVQRLTVSDCELIYTSFNVATRIFTDARGNNQGFRNPDRFHPTQKPIKLYDWIFKNYSEPHFKILDTHGGSMSSVISADKNGMEMVCCELDKDYFDKAVERFNIYKQQLTLGL